MLKSVFTDVIIKNLCAYYERKLIPTPSTLDLWYEKVRKIPDEPAGWIANRIQDTQEMFPRNLPNTLWEMYREWLSSNPDRVALRRQENCKKCNGDGYYFATRTDAQGNTREFVFRCPACEQSHEAGIPMWSMSFVGEGFQPVPDQTKPATKMPSLRAMTDGIGKPTPQVSIIDDLPF